MEKDCIIERDRHKIEHARATWRRSPLARSVLALVENRTRRTFTERDRSLLNTLRINISEACEAASRHAVPSASLMMEALEPLVGGSIVTVEASGRLLFCSDHAQKHFETFFTAEKPFIGGLPLTVKKWVRRQNAAFETVELTRRPQPLTVWCGEKNLEIQLASTRDRTCV
jgi:hypothetical protein